MYDCEYICLIMYKIKRLKKWLLESDWVKQNHNIDSMFDSSRENILLPMNQDIIEKFFSDDVVRNAKTGELHLFYDSYLY